MGAPSLVGRTGERESLHADLTSAIGGQGHLVLIGGTAGIGKTTLVRDLVAEARARGVIALTGHCYDLTNTPPYGPWLDLVAGYTARVSWPEPPAAFANGRLEGITSQASLFAETRRFLAAMAGIHPLLVVLEDLHWSDPSSLELLRHVAGHLEDVPMLLLVTYRDDELTRRHPFYQQLPALIRESHGRRLSLRRLDQDGLRALVRAEWALDAADEERLTDYLERHAEGNPFFATELLRALAEEGLLDQRADGARLGELDRVIVPPLLRQVIDSRISRLGDETRAPLSVAAVIGQDVPLDLWAEIAGMDEDALLTIVEGAIDTHLLEAERDGTRVRFVHALTREALFDGILPPRRRLWQRRAAEVMAARPGADPDVVAYHFEQAGDLRAADWLVRAGERAQLAYAWLTAGERFAAAANLLAGVPGEERRRARILCRVARVMRFAQPAAALPGVDEAIRLAEQIGDVATAAEGQRMRGLLLCYTDDYLQGCAEMETGTAALEALGSEAARSDFAAEDWLADALPVRPLPLQDDESAPADLLAAGLHHRRGILSACLAYSGRFALALETSERFLAALSDAALTSTLIRVAQAHCLHGMAVALAAMGRIAEAREVFTRAATAYRAIDHHAGVAFTRLNELHTVVLPYHPSDLALRRRLAVEIEDALDRSGGALPPNLSPRLGQIAVAFLDGEWSDVRATLDSTVSPGNSLLRREVTAVRAAMARQQGQPAAAWRQIHSLLTDGPATPPGRLIYPEALALLRLAADLALDEGNLPAARRWLEAHDRWVAWGRVPLGRAEGLIAWARVHRATGDIDAARDCAEEALAEASAPPQPLVLRAAHLILGQIATEGGQWPEAERHLMRALALAEDCAAPFERAEALLALATLHLAQGKRQEAELRREQAATIGAALGAVTLHTAVDRLAAANDASGEHRVAYPASLTQREVEVLKLVAEGLTDGGVAERLFISPRTVSQHLRSIYSKLDVSSRSAATRFAVEQGLI